MDLPFDAEHLALLACALARPGASVDARVATLVTESFDWARFATSARAHRLRPQVAQAIPALVRRCPASEVADEIRSVAGANAGHARFYTGELVMACEALRDGGVEAVAFKGPAFAEWIGQDVSRREMDDLDFVVPASRVADAAAALGRLGYRASLPREALASTWLEGAGHEVALTRAADGMLVELHWRLAPPWQAAPCTVAEVAAAASPRRFHDAVIRWPDAEHLLLMHVGDGMKSCGCGMRWAADVAAIVRMHEDLDWQRAGEIAAGNGALDGVRVALALVRSLCAELACRLCDDSFALRLAPPAARWADEALGHPRLARAVRAIRTRMAKDEVREGALAHFGWAIATADRPLAATKAVARYLVSPSIADLRALPRGRSTQLGLRLRAARRRLGMGG